MPSVNVLAINRMAPSAGYCVPVAAVAAAQPNTANGGNGR